MSVGDEECLPIVERQPVVSSKPSSHDKDRKAVPPKRSPRPVAVHYDDTDAISQARAAYPESAKRAHPESYRVCVQDAKAKFLARKVQRASELGAQLTQEQRQAAQ